MAGFIAENIETGKVKQFHYEDLADLRSRPGVMLLDTRTVGSMPQGMLRALSIFRWTA